MKLENMNAEDLELLSLTDIAYKLLHEGKKTLNTPSIFKSICELLGYDDSVYENKISEFYTSLTMDKRFILLDNGEWDLSHNHSINLIVDDDEDEDDTSDLDEEIIEEEESDNIDIDSEISDEDTLDDNDDIDDLTILGEDEMEADE